MHRALLSARLKPCPDVTARPELHKPKINCAKIANCSGRRSAEGRDTCLAHWPRTSHECELGLEGLLLHPVPLRNFGGTRRSVDSPPRKGNNRISEASFALARAKCLRRTGSGWNHYCRLHILPDTGGILNINRPTETPVTPFISSCYGEFKAGQNSPRCGPCGNEKSRRN